MPAAHAAPPSHAAHTYCTLCLPHTARSSAISSTHLSFARCKLDSADHMSHELPLHLHVRATQIQHGRRCWSRRSSSHTSGRKHVRERDDQSRESTPRRHARASRLRQCWDERRVQLDSAQRVAISADGDAPPPLNALRMHGNLAVTGILRWVHRVVVRAHQRRQTHDSLTR